MEIALAALVSLLLGFFWANCPCCGGGGGSPTVGCNACAAGTAPQSVSATFAGVTGGALDSPCAACTASNATLVADFVNWTTLANPDFPGSTSEQCNWRFPQDANCHQVDVSHWWTRLPNGQIMVQWRASFLMGRATFLSTRGVLVNFREPYRPLGPGQKEDCCAVTALALAYHSHSGVQCGVTGASATITAGPC